MSYSVPPVKDYPLGQWATDAAAAAIAAPASFGLTIEQAGQLHELATTYNDRLAAANAINTRGPLAVERKDASKQELLLYARALVAMVRSNPDVGLNEKQILGIRPRQPKTPSKPPTVAPDLDVISIAPTEMTVRVHNAATVSSRRRPAGVAGAAIWTFVGPVPPMDPMQWHFAGNYTKPSVTLSFPGDVEPGTKVWAAAYWYNRLGQFGPVSLPLEARLPGATITPIPQQQSGDETPFMKAA